MNVRPTVVVAPCSADAAPDGIGPDAPVDDPRALDAGADPVEAAADVP